ncbi:MAG: MerR family transcriptional regulator [Desulfobacteraceae bacterium]|jgi:DNA-binding transcriptional MerR regulator
MNSRTFTIQEASRQTNVSTHTLRYWEKILDGIVVPLRTPGGQRRYTRDHLLLLEEIKRLKRKGFTLAAIREELSQSMTVERLEPDSPTLEHLADHIAEAVRTTIYRFFQGKNKD